jgi:hypothetical protein
MHRLYEYRLGLGQLSLLKTARTRLNSNDYLLRFDCFCWAYISTGTAIGAYFRVNLIDVAFGNRFYRTLANAGTTSGTIVSYYMSHITNYYYKLLQLKISQK